MTPVLRTLLRGDAGQIAGWLDRSSWRSSLSCCAVIAIGCGVYGYTVGLWRAPLQAIYTGAKVPLLIFLTCGGNALLNGMLAQLLGSGLSFRQTSLAILLSFAAASIVLAALSPVTLFVLLNTPPLDSRESITGHSITLLMHVAVIACAGVVANRHLFRLLVHTSGTRAAARRVLFSWLAGNLLLGSQLAWVLRPFIGSPNLAVEFLRPDPLRGNFYEAVGRAFQHVLF